jgi:hypothetical protein
MAERLLDKDHPKTRRDQGDATPPHGDELQSERSFGRTDRYANADDSDGEGPMPSDDVRGQDDERDKSER